MAKTLTLDVTSFKFADNETDLNFRAFQNGISVSDNSLSATIKIKQVDIGYLQSVSAKWVNNHIVISSGDLSDLPVGSYLIELWLGNSSGYEIYPDSGFVKLYINQNATGISGNLISSITLGEFQQQFSDLSTEILNNLPEGKVGPQGEKGDTGPQGIQGIQGERGEQGEQGQQGIQGVAGKDFSIAETFSSVASMNSGGLTKGDFVMISSTVEDPDNAKLYLWNGTDFTFITDMSGATGIKGDDGQQGIQGEQGPKGEQGIQGIQGLQGDKGDDGKNGLDGESAYDFAVKGGYTGTQQDFKKKLSFQLKMPTSYYLDRTTTPWSLVFDNGSILQLPDYDKGATIYGYGFIGNMNSNALDNYPVVGNVIKTARGMVTLDTWKTTKDSETYWSDKTTVINPVNDTSLFDFTNASFGRTGTYQSRQKNVIRIMYALGIWNSDDIISMGAVKN